MSIDALEPNILARYVDAAVEIIPGGANAEIVLICEHGGSAVPSAWNNLGLPEALFATHYGQDLGSKELTLSVARRLGATAVVANYSRLYLDYNRKFDDPDCIRLDVGGIPIPANINITERDRKLREDIARRPLERAIASWMEGTLSKAKVAVSIHSFTPVWYNKFRSCEVGVMWRDSEAFPANLLQKIAEQDVYRVDENQPYSFKDSDWFTLDRHGLSIGVANAYIEVRNDLIDTKAKLESMSAVLAKAIIRSASEFK
ncbi:MULTISPECIES: N-formylglutamate amidohydrolase [Pseudomonas]|uniref:N-formylglutamate amidohydrolase n=1 Tax=Pseudomonas putida TaxID=303 RepID=A0A2S3XD10_PSEPU|nr:MULTISPECIES: N-formylglutamate amidohydrolase [Pseudomonas]PTC01745.1 hypothetical protein C9975_00435 [Thalassospira xiamenensis]AVD83783.1 hypothetical protein C4Q28_17180 [Pseudomonas sp. SWI6]AVD95047.1 hypothetical protein C4Q27_22935 [Pseudomonas sp. SWI36]ELU0814316.1 N-formylglutamate amidohydrolase [Pseudomonas putida]MBH3388630.1 N-formylglutamate amidohydrolase [Pseudomonas putida]